jgi:hypothetical protein
MTESQIGLGPVTARRKGALGYAGRLPLKRPGGGIPRTASCDGLFMQALPTKFDVLGRCLDRPRATDFES